MAEFKKFFPLLKQLEGGYVNNPNDTGGKTYAGISVNNYPHWNGWFIISNLERQYPSFLLNSNGWKNFTKILKTVHELNVEIEKFYEEEFWNAMNLSLINNQFIANDICDFGVNAGKQTSIKLLQTALNLTNRVEKDYQDIDVDGKLGVITANLVNNTIS